MRIKQRDRRPYELTEEGVAKEALLAAISAGLLKGKLRQTIDGSDLKIYWQSSFVATYRLYR